MAPVIKGNGIMIPNKVMGLRLGPMALSIPVNMCKARNKVMGSSSGPKGPVLKEIS